MKVRVISAIVALPLIILPIYFGGWLMYCVIFVALLLGIYEFNHTFGIKDIELYLLPMVSTAIYLMLLWFGKDELLIVSMTFMILSGLFFFVKKYPKEKMKEVMISAFSFFYITVTLSYIVMLRDIEIYGAYLVWLIFSIAFGSDTFAYLVGKTFGKRKLAPLLSPNKTVAGAIGGVFGAAILTVVIGALVAGQGLKLELIHYIGFAIMGMIGSGFGQLGDLAASAMKRITGAKDFGKVMPGHGGIVDRMDSVIFVAPFVYYCCLFILRNVL